MDQEVKVKITADSSGAVSGFQRFREEMFTTENKSASTVSKIKENWMGLTAAAIAVGVAARKITDTVGDIAMAAARYDTLGIVMRTVGNNAGYTGEQMDKFAKGLEKTGISMSASREVMARMVQAQLDLNEASKLARIAQDAAVIGNINSSEALTRLIYGIQSAQVEVLRTIGINVNFENSYARIAKETGRTTTSFSETEKAAIRMNAVLSSGAQIAGTYEAAMETAGKQLLSLERHFDNLKVLAGEAFTPALAEIVQTVTGAVVGLNGELSGPSRESVREWGTNFRITMISVEAEIMRIAMLLDKFGGTLSSASMLLYGPGAALGVESSSKRFEKAAQANIEYENRYKKTDKALEELALKQIRLEESLTAAGKARAKAEEDALEKKRLAASAARRATETDTVPAAMKADNKDAEKAAREAERLAREAARAIEKANTEAIQNMKKTAEEGYKETIDHLRGIAEYQEIMYQESTFSLDPYQQATNRIIDAERRKAAELKDLYEKQFISFTEYEEAKVLVAENTAKQMVQLNQMVFEDQLGSIAQGVGDLSTAFQGLSRFYAEGSEDARKWEEAARAMEIAQRAVAVVQAVAAIATQGLGDPYTAFARVAAMAATMGALLATIGESAGGGSASSAAPPAMGNSTVLGAEYGAASESITNSLALLEETYNMEDIKLTKIYNELRSVNMNITGLVSSILLTGGAGAFEGPGQSVNSPNVSASLLGTILPSQLPGMEELALFMYENMAAAGQAQSQYIASTLAMFDPLTGLTHQLLEVLSGGLFGQNIGNLISSILGGDVSTMVGSTGIEIGETVIRAIMEGAQVSARKYMWYVTETEGGWFGSDSRVYGTIYSQLDESVVNMFTKVFSNMGNTLLYLAGELGTDINAVYDYVFETTRIHLMGKTGDDISDALVEYFSKIGDQAAEDLFGDVIRQYQEVNEGLLETAVRLVQDKIVVGAWLSMTNQAFNSTIDKTIALTESLIKMAGGMDALTDSMQTYYDAFFSDAEKQYDLENQLRAALGSYGFNLPGTRAGYRDLVESLDLTTEAGQAAYVALMKMSEGADAYYDYLEKAKGSIKESDYATRAEYLRALASVGYADGGISSGPESGYLAKLHGTELVVSPRTAYSAKVTGINTDELVREVRQLREEIGEANFNIAANSAKMARLLDQWDGEGLPETRT
jgi:hypothetical protein